MSKWGKRTVVIVTGLFLLVLGLIFLRKPDPEYRGRPFSDWILRVTPWSETADANFQPTEAEVREAVLTVGTNNLPVLAHWISYDSGKSIFIPMFRIMPLWFNQLSIFDPVIQKEMRGNDLAGSAAASFQLLGEAGVPAIPELEGILCRSTLVPGGRALTALTGIGEPAIPSIIKAASLSNCPTRFLAIRALWAHTNNPAAYSFLTNALNDPDSHVRGDARDALRGIELY